MQKVTSMSKRTMKIKTPDHVQKMAHSERRTCFFNHVTPLHSAPKKVPWNEKKYKVIFA